LFRSFEAFQRPIALRVILSYAEDGVNIPDIYQDTPSEFLEERESQYNAALTRALNVSKTYDADDSGVVTENERARKIGSRRIRLG
jgi:hypothetical protein